MFMTVNNAGIAAKSFETTPEGFEVTMAVKYHALSRPEHQKHQADREASHLGHFLLTMKLLPILQCTAEAKDSDVRVVTVLGPYSSSASL